MNSYLKLGAFDHASFIFKKKKKKGPSSSSFKKKKKNQDFKIFKNHLFISKLEAFGSASFK